MDEEVKQPEQTEVSENSYAKRPIWQWMIIYAVIGVVIYGLVYFLILNKRGYNSGGSYSQTSYPTITANQTGTNNNNPVTEVKVTLTKDGFSPNVVRVKAGTKVTWINQSGETATVNSNNHPTHLLYPPLNLGEFTDGGSLSLVFTTQGTYGYHNHYKPSEAGSVVVQ